MKKQIKQILENLPQEILDQPRFFSVNEAKEPLAEGWNKPENQKPYNEIQGLVGFDTAGHDVYEDYLFLDFDHIFNDAGQFVNVLAEEWYTKIRDALKTYCELSASSTGAHMIAKPTKGKFKKISSGKNGRIYFSERRDDDAPFLELFYGTGGRYCLFTGNVFECEPNNPITQGQAADDVFTMCLEEITKQNQKPPKTPLKPQEANSAVLVYQSQSNTREYDIYRAEKMLDVIRVADLSREDWLNVGMALKNNGNTCSDWERWSRDDERFKQDECETLWQGFTYGGGLTIATIADLANRYGYDPKAVWKEWCDLHPEFKNQIIHRPEPMTDDQQEKISWTQDKIKSCPVNYRIPDDWIFSSNGITQVIETKTKTKYLPVTKTPLVPAKIFYDPIKKIDVYEIAILSRGKWRHVEVDARTLGDARALNMLCDYGALILDNGRLKIFLAEIIALNPDMQEIQAFSKTGWANDDCTEFIYPYAGAPYIVRRAGFEFDKTFKQKGNAELWKQKFVEVTKQGGATTLAYFGIALSATIAKPILGFNPSGHLYGKSGGGKTALQKFIASTYGNPVELMRSFAATNKNRLLVAAAFDGLPTFFDELETLRDKKAEEALSTDIYNFYDGKGNQANKRDGTAREAFKFRASRLTTGERPILKQHDLRGAFKRILTLETGEHFLPDELTADLHFFSESNFGHFGKVWIDFVSTHLEEIKEEYEFFAKFYTPLKTYEPTHLKILAGAIVSVEFFSVAIGVKSAFDKFACTRNMRAIVDTLPTLAELDDTTRAIKDLNSYVAAHEKSFTRDEKDNETGKVVEISAWGTACFGKIFDTGEVAFHPTELKRILEDELHYASADKLINEWNSQGNILITDKGRMTHVIRIGGKTYRAVHFRANIISTDIDSAEEHYYEELLKDN